MALKIVTQTDSIEQGDKKNPLDNWMDDCAWATLACAANHLTGSTWKSKDAIAWGEKVGRHDRDGFGDPTSLAQLAKASKLAGLKAKYPKSWDEVIKALNADAVIGVNVEQAKNYPPKVRLSSWHQKREKKKPGHPYGHMVCFAKLGDGAQFADPTMSGVGAEEYAVPVSLDEFKQIASSKGEAPHTKCIIWTPIKPKAPEGDIDVALTVAMEKNSPTTTSMNIRAIEEAKKMIADPNLPPKNVHLLLGQNPINGTALKKELQLLIDQINFIPWGAKRQIVWDRIDEIKRKLKGNTNV